MDDIQKLKGQLAIACRVLALHDFGDFIFGHVSARLPGASAMLMKPNGLGIDEIMPEDLLVVDFDGQVLEGPHPRHLEYPIHAEILRARADVGAVVHAHPPFSVALGASDQDLLPITEHGCYFCPPAVPKFSETSDLIVTREQGVAIARTLGQHKAVLMCNHGMAAIGGDIQEATISALLLEQACRTQVLTSGLGPHFSFSSDADAIARRERVFPRFTAQLWAYMVRQACRRWPECREFTDERGDVSHT